MTIAMHISAEWGIADVKVRAQIEKQGLMDVLAESNYRAQSHRQNYWKLLRSRMSHSQDDDEPSRCG